MATATALTLRVKPFGKDWVRVLYTGGAEGTVLEVRQQQEHKPSSSSSDGVTTVETKSPLQLAQTHTHSKDTFTLSALSLASRRAHRG